MLKLAYMRQIFRFKSFPTPGWLIVALLPVVIVYFNYAPSVFDRAGLSLNQIDNKFVVGIIFLLPLYSIYFIVSKLIQKKLITNSYLEIKDGQLDLVILSKTKWSVSINSITALDETQGQHSVKADFLKVLLSRGRGTGLIGFSLSAQNQIYEVKPFLEDFDFFKQTISNLNPSIKFEAITAKADKDFYNMDLGKALQDKAPGVPVVTGIGKFISKLNFATGFILFLIITLSLLFWLVMATN
jgi:hypothetical protein